jgi:hypothetical protein
MKILTQLETEVAVRRSAMKKFVFACLLGLTTMCAISVASKPVTAQWADYTFSQPPVPHYEPFRGYVGSQTYIGQDYTWQNYTFVGFDDVLNAICRYDWCDANNQCWYQNVYC